MWFRTVGGFPAVLFVKAFVSFRTLPVPPTYVSSTLNELGTPAPTPGATRVPVLLRNLRFRVAVGTEPVLVVTKSVTLPPNVLFWTSAHTVLPVPMSNDMFG